MSTWADIVKAAIPAAIGATGAIVGNKKANAANAASKADLEAGYQETKGANQAASGHITDLNTWLLNQGLPVINTGYSNQRADLGNTLQQATGAIQAGRADVGNVLKSYTNAGNRGSAETNFLLYGNRPSPDGGQVAPQAPQPRPTAPTQAPNVLQGFGPIAPPPTTGTATAPAAATGGNALQSLASHLSDNKVPQPGALGQIAASVAGGSLLGPVIGGLAGRLTRHNREKEGASSAANEFSDYIWKDVMPQAKAQGWTKEQLQSAVESGKRDYSNWLDQNLKDKGVKSNSAQSQFGYLDKDLAGVYAGWGK